MPSWGVADPLTTRPGEDTGAETLAWYQFQQACAVRHLIDIANNGPLFSVTCEWHTDYLLRSLSLPTEIVSVKHLERHKNFTLLSICSDGGLKVLYEKWRSFGEGVQCRLVTSSGLSVGDSGIKALYDACRSSDNQLIGRLALKMKSYIGSDAESVARFLESLIIEIVPQRHDIRSRLIEEELRPILSALGIDEGLAVERYERLEALVARCSTDRPLPLDLASQARRNGWSVQTQENLTKVAQRTILRPDIIRCLQGMHIDLLTAEKLLAENPNFVKNLTDGNTIAGHVPSLWPKYCTGEDISSDVRQVSHWTRSTTTLDAPATPGTTWEEWFPNLHAIHYCNVPRIAMLAALKGVEVALPAEPPDRRRGIGLLTAGFVHSVAAVIPKIRPSALRMTPQSRFSDFPVGSLVAFEHGVRTKNVPPPHEAGSFRLTGNLIRDPHIYIQRAGWRITMPIDPTWITTDTAFGDLMSGSTVMSGLFLIKRKIAPGEGSQWENEAAYIGLSACAGTLCANGRRNGFLCLVR